MPFCVKIKRNDTQEDKGIRKTEYRLYTFSSRAANDDRPGEWRLHDCLPDRAQAVRKATQLMNTQDYKKVEIHKKYFDSRQSRPVNSEFRVLQDRKKFSMLRSAVLFLLMFAIGLTAMSLGNVIG